MMRGEAAAALVLPVRRYSAAAAPSAASSSTPSSSRPTPRYTVEQQRDKILAELRITRFAQPSLDRVAYLLVNCKTTDDWAADMKCLRAYLVRAACLPSPSTIHTSTAPLAYYCNNSCTPPRHDCCCC